MVRRWRRPIRPPPVEPYMRTVIVRVGDETTFVLLSNRKLGRTKHLPVYFSDRGRKNSIPCWILFPSLIFLRRCHIRVVDRVEGRCTRCAYCRRCCHQVCFYFIRPIHFRSAVSPATVVCRRQIVLVLVIFQGYFTFEKLDLINFYSKTFVSQSGVERRRRRRRALDSIIRSFRDLWSLIFSHYCFANDLILQLL